MKFADTVRFQNRDADAAWAMLNPDEKSHLIATWREAQRRNVDLLAAVLANEGQPEAVSLGRVIQELIAVKRQAGLNGGYLDDLESVLNRFADGREKKPIAAVDVVFVEKFLAGAKLASRTTLRARLSTLFNFAVRRKYRPDNPCAQLEPVKVTPSPPRVMSMTEVAKALTWLPVECPRLFPWFVLSTFCGLRPEEAAQTRWRDIHFAERWIKVEAQTTKVRLRRVVYPLPEAMALLKRAARSHKAIALTRASRLKALDRLRRHLGWPVWYQDVTRHTAASMWLAVEPDVAKVAAMLGNSPAVLLKHYKALVTVKEAKQFLALAITTHATLKPANTEPPH